MVPIQSKQRRVQALFALTVSTMFVLAKVWSKHQKKHRRQPKFLRSASTRPNFGKNTTPRRKLLSCGTRADFIVFTNLSRPAFFEKLLPLFEQFAVSVNFRSPYRQS